MYACLGNCFARLFDLVCTFISFFLFPSLNYPLSNLAIIFVYVLGPTGQNCYPVMLGPRHTPSFLIIGKLSRNPAINL
jgi:hypothetical protein